jgi:hypothetical protein
LVTEGFVLGPVPLLFKVKQKARCAVVLACELCHRRIAVHQYEFEAASRQLITKSPASSTGSPCDHCKT